MRTRGEHRPNADGYCARCGIRGTAREMCPPGWWMTEEEIDIWHGLADPKAYREVERRLGSQPEGDEP